MHHDLILGELDNLTKIFGMRLHDFSQKTCAHFDSKELQQEYNACIQREAKQTEHASHQPETYTEPTSASVTLPHTGDPQQGIAPATCMEEQDSGERTNVAGSSSTTAGLTRIRNQGWWSKTFNINTYEFHSYGDYAETIQMQGTMDSYSTEPVSILEHMITNKWSNLLYLGGAGTSLTKIQIHSHQSQAIFEAVDLHWMVTDLDLSYLRNSAKIRAPRIWCSWSDYSKSRETSYYRKITKLPCKYSYSYARKQGQPSYEGMSYGFGTEFTEL